MISLISLLANIVTIFTPLFSKNPIQNITNIGTQINIFSQSENPKISNKKSLIDSITEALENFYKQFYPSNDDTIGFILELLLFILIILLSILAPLAILLYLFIASSKLSWLIISLLSLISALRLKKYNNPIPLPSLLAGISTLIYFYKSQATSIFLNHFQILPLGKLPLQNFIHNVKIIFIDLWAITTQQPNNLNNILLLLTLLFSMIILTICFITNIIIIKNPQTFEDSNWSIFGIILLLFFVFFILNLDTLTIKNIIIDISNWLQKLSDSIKEQTSNGFKN